MAENEDNQGAEEREAGRGGELVEGVGAADVTGLLSLALTALAGAGWLLARLARRLRAFRRRSP